MWRKALRRADGPTKELLSTVAKLHPKKRKTIALAVATRLTMPLKKGSSHKTISSNIKTEMKGGQAAETGGRYRIEEGWQEQEVKTVEVNRFGLEGSSELSGGFWV